MHFLSECFCGFWKAHFISPGPLLRLTSRSRQAACSSGDSNEWVRLWSWGQNSFLLLLWRRGLWHPSSYGPEAAFSHKMSFLIPCQVILSRDSSYITCFFKARCQKEQEPKGNLVCYFFNTSKTLLVFCWLEVKVIRKGQSTPNMPLYHKNCFELVKL